MKVRLFAGTAMPALVAFGLFSSSAAMAQEAAADDGGIQEIIVTAQKRTENVQDVPIAISAFAGDALSERAVSNVSQLASLSPNVNLDSGVSFTASTAVLAASIRGIGASDLCIEH
jgi:iron complex outermembrane receptor protein